MALLTRFYCGYLLNTLGRLKKLENELTRLPKQQKKKKGKRKKKTGLQGAKQTSTVEQGRYVAAITLTNLQYSIAVTCLLPNPLPRSADFNGHFLVI